MTSDAFFDRLIERGAYVAWYFHYIPVGAMAVPELLPTPEGDADKPHAGLISLLHGRRKEAQDGKED